MKYNKGDKQEGNERECLHLTVITKVMGNVKHYNACQLSMTEMHVPPGS